MANLRKVQAWLGGILLVLLLFGLHRGARVQLSDGGDRSYHLAVSRELARSSSLHLKNIPQAEDLGWNEYYPDKEFLFHVITGAGYRLGGEQGAVLAGLACAAAALLAIYAFALFYLPPFSAALAAFTGFFTYDFLYRMFLLRPFVLAVACFLFLNVALVRRSSRFVALACFLFFLSYHAYFVPLICLGLVAALALLEPREERILWGKTVACGLAGCVVGILVNPYFPANVVFGWRQSLIPFLMRTELRFVNFGIELFPLNTEAFFSYFGLSAAVLLGGIFLLGAQEKGRRLGDLRYRYLLALCFSFAVISLRSVRGTEYFVPAAALLLVAMLERWPWAARTRGVALAALAFFQAAHLFQLYRAEAWRVLGEDYINATTAALELIPKGRNLKVYNCDWDTGGQILYQRPDLRLVELLDPTYLYFWSYPDFVVREQLRQGEVGDARHFIARVFDSDYVLCLRDDLQKQLGELSRQLASDPGFQLLYPRAQELARGAPTPVALFRVRKEPLAQFVVGYELTRLPRLSEQEARGLKPGKRQEKVEVRLLPPEQGHFFHLPESEGGVPYGLRCAFLSPVAAEIRRLAGADYLALGGGQSMRVWRNGRPLFSAGKSYGRARDTRVVVPLGTKLQASDRLDVLVCSSQDPSAIFALSVSLWKEKELADVCAWKAREAGQVAGVDGLWKTAVHETCIGELAEPAAPASLREARY